jgi:hypothetical protein
MVARTLPVSCTDQAIRQLVAEWSEFLAAEDYLGALALCPGVPGAWDAKLLQKTVEGYGVPDNESDTLSLMLEEHHVERFVVATLIGNEHFNPIKSIVVDREHLYGLDPSKYLGMVHFNDVPLNSGPSDLTARFHILRHGPGKLILEFLDIHVM